MEGQASMEKYILLHLPGDTHMPRADDIPVIKAQPSLGYRSIADGTIMSVTQIAVYPNLAILVDTVWQGEPVGTHSFHITQVNPPFTPGNQSIRQFFHCRI
jgi:hypothetical protein